MYKLYKYDDSGLAKWKKVVLLITHIAVLLASGLLIFMISADTFRNSSFLVDPLYLKIELWVCILFIIDIVVEFIFSSRKWYYTVTHIFFLLVSIPYLNILGAIHISLQPQVEYTIRFLPLFRAAYVVAMVLVIGNKNKISSMFVGYICLMVLVLYFGSLMFFVVEHGVNPDVDTYWSALWWAFMSMTTAGCYIGEVTATGKALCALMSGIGIMLFPVFTVYITNAVLGKSMFAGDSEDTQNTVTGADSNTQMAYANAKNNTKTNKDLPIHGRS